MIWMTCWTTLVTEVRICRGAYSQWVPGITAIGAKIRDFKGMFGRLFGVTFSGFQLWGAAPEASKRA
jgi:hypothetical protein